MRREVTYMEEIIRGILMKIKGKYFETTDISLDEPACMNCHRLVDDIPFRLFLKGKTYVRELHFCFKCAEELELFKPGT